MNERLFTPGPLTTSPAVKKAMLRDLGSRDTEFIETVRWVRGRILELVGTSVAAGYEAIPVQGSGTFALESTISSVVPRGGKLLGVTNGAYGERLVTIARRHGIEVEPLSFPECQPIAAERIERVLVSDPTVTHVSVVHCETSTGLLNPLESIAGVVSAAGRSLIVDAMSSYGGIPIDVKGSPFDFLISSSNKCVQGVPGFAFVIARRNALKSTEGFARTIALDLFAQWQGLESNGQFRFTPPTHVILAFAAALRELEAEGGVPARHARYRANHQRLVAGMRELGYEEVLAPEFQSPIITSFRYPPGFSFEVFYEKLRARECVIYPGKVSEVDSFRIGTIGHLFESDIDVLLDAIREDREQRRQIEVSGEHE